MIKFENIKNNIQHIIKNPLKLAIIGGLALLLLVAVLTLFYIINRDTTVFPEQTSRTYLRDLDLYDSALLTETVSELSIRLDNLERHARRQEDWLSVLKRRRELVLRDPGLISAYRESTLKAVNTFPYSEVMIAIAGEALVRSSMDPVTINETRELLRGFANRISQERFIPLALSFHVMAGSFADPGIAMEIPNLERFFSANLTERLRDSLFVNNTLLGILRRRDDSSVRINELIRLNPDNQNYLRLGGEYFYDHGNPLRAGELFLRLGDDYILRAADALVLANEVTAARNIWSIIANSENETQESLKRSFYNLAVTSEDNNDGISWLERIFAFGTGNNYTEESLYLYSLIQYTRLQHTLRSMEILEAQNLRDSPLLDLELLRRQLDIIPFVRSQAEVWLLLGRHPQSQELFQWGAWFFEWQNLDTELAQLFRLTEQRDISGSWIDLGLALLLIREGRINEGSRILEAASTESVLQDWRIPANLARVMESRRAINQALILYEQAADLVDNRTDNAVLQFRISRCLNALGRFEEAQGTLRYALELDPENLLIRLESQRLLGR